MQDDVHAYFIDRVRVSDFLYPTWFESFRARGEAPFDHRGHCVRPLQVLSGGYASVTHTHWQRGWRDVGPSRGKPGPSHGTRRGRRRADRASWRRSAG